ncbi:MAG: TRAP transporter small permease subunit [Pseudomonadota bacterium]
MQARSDAAQAQGSLGRLVVAVDAVLEGISRVFHVAANLCLLLMLAGTAATIVLRPLGLSFYWIWPWSMQVFVWMSFIGFYVVYRKGKDISVDFVMRKIGPGAMYASRIFVAFVILAVIGVILVQMPTILESQVGVIDGVLTPWGTELERYTLSIPLGVSCVLIFVNTLLDLAKAFLGWPEPHAMIIADE